MKKYVKPELFYENFELSQHIAACGIDVDLTNATQDTCATLDKDFWPGLGGTTVFQENTSCAIAISNIEVYCYTVGTSEAGRTFTS